MATASPPIRESTRARPTNRATKRHLLAGLLFISPWLLGFLIFTLYPIIASLYLSFTDYRVLSPPRWVGLAVAVLGALSLLGLGVGWSAINHANSVEQTTQTSVKQANDALAQKLAKEDEINQQLQSDRGR